MSDRTVLILVETDFKLKKKKYFLKTVPFAFCKVYLQYEGYSQDKGK